MKCKFVNCKNCKYHQHHEIHVTISVRIFEILKPINDMKLAVSSAATCQIHEQEGIAKLFSMYRINRVLKVNGNTRNLFL